MRFDGFSKIVDKDWIQDDVVMLTIERISEMGEISPGQFFNIQASAAGYPMLRRPISVSGYDDKTITFTVKILGSGTKQLAERRVGDAIKLMGPLGNGFERVSAKKVLIIGGGIGVAPMKGLIEKLEQPANEIDVILGFKDNPYLTEHFKTRCQKIAVFSETVNGFRKGFVTEALEEWIKITDYEMVYACGPLPMLKSVAKILNETGIPVQLLMEEKMACGIGACLVCTCKTKKDDFNFKLSRMCKDGPMFYGSEVIFDEA